MKTALSNFIVTAEFYPPREANRSEIEKRAMCLKEVVDAVVVRDNPLAQARVSPLATAALLLSAGLETIVQISIRDKNRLAIQADILGASTLGVKKFLFLEDVHQATGDEPGAKGVFDLDAVQLISLAKKLNKNGLVGTRVNPFAHPLELHLLHLSKKIKAGATFVQTTPVFDLKQFKEFLACIKEKDFYLLAGVRPVKSWQTLQSMSEVPEEIMRRMKNAPESKQAEEGIEICVETIKALREIKGVDGIHIFAPDWEASIPVVVHKADLR